MSAAGVSESNPADEDNIIEGEVIKLEKEFEVLKNDFVAEKTAIENTINKPLVPAPGAGGEAPEAAEAPEAIPTSRLGLELH